MKKPTANYNDVPDGTYSVTEFANAVPVSTAAVRSRCDNNNFPKGITSKKVGNTHIITVKRNGKTKKGS